MNETKQIDTLSVIAEAAKERELRTAAIASVRVSPGPYLAFASLLSFAAVLLFRVQSDTIAVALFTIAWVLLPFLALTDRIVFDGRSLSRRGVIAFILRLYSGQVKTLKVVDIETVETNAVRTLRRGGRVRYRYRTEITGNGCEFVFASGGRSYRKLIRELLPLIHEDKLDSRSFDLRDYLSDPGLLKRKTRSSNLASSAVLDVATSDFRLGRKQDYVEQVVQPSAEEIERAHLLRRLGNELRVAGRLREAGEAFRRALNVNSRGAWLTYDLGRLLRSQASAQGDARLLVKARAALRLARIRADKDLVLLPLVADSLLECGDARQAQLALQKALELDEGSVKARLGLADLALRDGKLAHVIHHYHEAARISSDQALARYARREADYYLRLNDDEDYLVGELRRINWLQNVTRVRRLAVRGANCGILMALIGGYLDPVAAGLGWSIASSSLIAWILTVIGTRVLFQRSKPRPVV